VRPESFVEINNFYTVTVYEKGAEIIGMLKRLVGDDAYRTALDLYFTRHDGDAATIEDWLSVFEDSTGRDLNQFKLWYSQAGTPQITVKSQFEKGTYTLTFTQEIPATPGQSAKKPMVIPIAMGLLDDAGSEITPTRVLELTKAEQSFSFEGLKSAPTPSLLRGFSAPVTLNRDSSDEERAFLLAHDTDPFNRWEAGRTLTGNTLLRLIAGNTAATTRYLDALLSVARDPSLDPAFRALVLTLPSQDDSAQALAQSGHTPDPMAIHRGHETLKQQIAQHFQDVLPGLYADMQVPGPYTPDANDGGKRAFGNAVLGLLTQIDGGTQAQKQYDAADNMTQQLAALSALLSVDKGRSALSAFEGQWHADRLVMDKWFGMQVRFASPERAKETAQQLTQHADFDMKTPNRFRSVFGALAQNPAGFHVAGGSTYAFFADWLIRLDPLNPQTTARMTAAFETWRRYDSTRQTHVKTALNRILSTPNLSRDTTEMVTRILGDAK
jgi:aminopeptidase N